MNPRLGIAITADPHLGLISITVQRETREPLAWMIDAADLQRVVERITVLAAEMKARGIPGERINFADVVTEVLGPPAG